MITEMKPMDKTKLKKALNKCGFDLKGASLKMGCTTGLFSKDRVSNRTLKQLESMFNIKYEDIAPDTAPDVMGGVEPKQEHPAPQTIELVIDWQKLEWFVRRAVAGALQDRNLGEEMYRAFIKALEGGNK